MAKPKAAFKPRENFIKFINYVHQVLDFEELEKAGYAEIYYSAMEYYRELFANLKMDFINDIEYEIMATIENKKGAMTVVELCPIFDVPRNQMSNFLYHLNKHAMVTQNKEKKQAYWSITPLGRKFLAFYLQEKLEKELEEENKKNNGGNNEK